MTIKCMLACFSNTLLPVVIIGADSSAVWDFTRRQALPILYVLLLMALRAISSVKKHRRVLAGHKENHPLFRISGRVRFGILMSHQCLIWGSESLWLSDKREAPFEIREYRLASPHFSVEVAIKD